MTEDQHQMCVIKWSQQPFIREKYPELKMLHHIANERKCSPVQGRMLKLMGVRSGVPDLSLPVPKSPYNGLYIEMKTETGRLSDNQKWWICELKKQGYRCEVCYGWEAAVAVLEDYLNGNCRT